MTQPEEFDKDIELAKLQVNASFFAAWYSVSAAVGFAIIASAFLALVAYMFATPQLTMMTFATVLAVLCVIFAIGLGGFLVVIAIKASKKQRQYWKLEFDRISKLAKAEKQSRPV
jgi:VIT1/CCC1 family predicted Fe2+/Mn2+ transporter